MSLTPMAAMGTEADIEVAPAPMSASAVCMPIAAGRDCPTLQPSEGSPFNVHFWATNERGLAAEMGAQS